MAYEVEFTDEFGQWYTALSMAEQEDINRVVEITDPWPHPGRK